MVWHAVLVILSPVHEQFAALGRELVLGRCDQGVREVWQLPDGHHSLADAGFFLVWQCPCAGTAIEFYHAIVPTIGNSSPVRQVDSCGDVAQSLWGQNQEAAADSVKQRHDWSSEAPNAVRQIGCFGPPWRWRDLLRDQEEAGGIAGLHATFWDCSGRHDCCEFWEDRC